MKYLIPFHDFLNESKLEDIYSKYYADIESNTFTQIISADPTSIVKNGEVVKMGIYSKWLLSLYKADGLKLEDLYKATGYLTTFDKLKKRKLLSGQQADILSFKTLPELFQTISEVGGTGKPTKDESYLINDQYFINNGQAELYFENADYLIVIPRTLEASQFYGKDTEWCTLKPNMFKKYSDQGNLYIIIDKRKLNSRDRKRRLQFHFESKQFMDMDDKNLKSEDKLVFYPMFKTHPDVINLRYDEVGKFYEGRAWVAINGKHGFVDLQGNEVIPLKYVHASNFREGRAYVSLNGKWGFVDEQGNEVVPLIYDLVSDFCEGRAWVSLNGKYGFVDLQGNEVIPLKYDDTFSFQEGRAWVKLNRKYGFVDLHGNEVIPLKYDNITSFFEGRAWVRVNRKYGFVDLQGNEVIPLKYDLVDNFREGRGRVKINDKWGYVDLQGNETWED
jgi:hypothetical protein